MNLVPMYSFARFKGDVNTKGIYGFSRNPMYVGGFLFLLGLNLMGWSISYASISFIIVSLFWTSWAHWQVLKEEGFLEHKYGNEYLDYKGRVPRYIFF